ncbi:Transcriptional regulator, ArsR family [Pseudomonas savastanoi pv. nerii]|nr:Transcriptional regulator, ArsR family [Pseudomonas savastanoi pv. nerii]
MDVEAADLSLAAVAGAIADPARSRMLCALLDGHARTATELAALADIGASSASGHFARLREQGLVEMLVQGPLQTQHAFGLATGSNLLRPLRR